MMAENTEKASNTRSPLNKVQALVYFIHLIILYIKKAKISISNTSVNLNAGKVSHVK